MAEKKYTVQGTITDKEGKPAPGLLVRAYTGFTQNLKLRFEQHNKGKVESAKVRCPLKLVYYEACLDRNDAT